MAAAPGPRLLPFALGGGAVAVAVALIGGGSLLASALSFAAGGLGLVGAVVAGGLAYAFGYRARARRVAGALALLFGSLLLAIPLGWAVGAVEVARAKAWCEQVVLHGAEPVPRPRRVASGGEAGESCLVTDPSTFMGWWQLDPATGAWAYVD